jgi:hypothetical protein
MNSDVMFPLPHGAWEKVWDWTTYWFYGAVLILTSVLRQSLGWWIAATAATMLAASAALMVRRIARPRRRRRIEENLARGVIEAVVRFPDEAGSSPNSGWKAGCLHLADTGFQFQQLRGRTSGPVGAPMQILHPQPLGTRPLNIKEAPELQQGFAVLGFTVGQREFEIAGDPAYLRALEIYGSPGSQSTPPRTSL